jgi:glycogen debranching enzyme
MSMSTDTSPKQDQSHIVIDGISYIPSSALLSGIQKISFKDNRAFAVVNSQGEAPRLYSSGSELGVYYNDTRYLGIWEMTINGSAPISLAHELRFGGSTAVFSMTNRDIPRLNGDGRISRDTFLIRRIMTLYEDALYETVEIKNFDTVNHPLQIEQWVGGRFDDIFEVRGFDRPKRGKMMPTEEVRQSGELISILQYEGLDGHVRKSYIQRFFEGEKIRISPGLAGYFTRIEAPAKSVILLKTIVSFDVMSEGRFQKRPYGQLSIAEKMQTLSSGQSDNPFSSLTFSSDNAIVNRSISNAQTDIYMLLTEEPGNLLYPYAGIPWFSAPFGRDGIITAYQLLPWYPNVAKGVLNYIFSTLGTKVDPFTDEEPGKIFHEMRRGEMAVNREVPFIPYYGSVDSTPLALILLSEYIAWTWDKKSLEEWWPFALKALDWIDQWGDSDGDGFVEYIKKSPTGLINQGWKDSHDSVMHRDGQLAKPPISLCEVQGYAFRARMGMSGLARFLGQNTLAERLRRDALLLKSLFTEKFWDSEGQFFYLALDGAHRPCAVRSSNMGHALWSHIATQEQAVEVVRALMSDAMFSGHGIRTLARGEASYNPLSYHNGSIWPHDNSLIMEGFRYYGYTAQLENLSLALLGVLESSTDFRLPELYCGFRKRGSEPPVPYEVACKPQAWAAGSIFLMLKSMLGISMDLDQSHLVFNSPLLTPKMNYLEVKNLRGRDWEMDLVIHRAKFDTTVEIRRKHGNVRVLTVK